MGLIYQVYKYHIILYLKYIFNLSVTMMMKFVVALVFVSALVNAANLAVAGPGETAMEYRGDVFIVANHHIDLWKFLVWMIENHYGLFLKKGDSITLNQEFMVKIQLREVMRGY